MPCRDDSRAWSPNRWSSGSGDRGGTTAVKTQLQASAKITGGTTVLWIPARTKLTLQCLAVGEKAYGAVAKADPYYYRVTYQGKTGYAIDADLYTAKDATALGLTYCSIPAEPGSPKAGSVTSSSVSLSWSDRSNNETSFRTQYSTDGGKTWKAGSSTGANRASVTVTGLKAATKYVLQIGASNNKGTKWSAYVHATTAKASTMKTAGTCDYKLSGSNYVRGTGKQIGRFTIGSWYLPVCGPRPYYDPGASVGAPGRGVNPYGTTNDTSDLDGYQCTELAARWLWKRDGVKYVDSAGHYGGGNGAAVVLKFAARFASTYTRIAASTALPKAGDVVSFSSSTRRDDTGHVGVVVSASASGVRVAEQNRGDASGAAGYHDYSVSNGKVKWGWAYVDYLRKK